MYKVSYNKIPKIDARNYTQEKTITIDKDITAFILVDAAEKRI
jgi:hypothetical protein